MNLTKPSDIRKARHKTLTTPGGFVFAARRLSPFDVLLCGGEADLAALAEADEASLSRDAALRREGEAFAWRLLRRALVGVRLLLEERKSYAEDELYAGDLPPEDALYLLRGILDWSGLTGEAAREMRPFSETDGGSSISTPPPAATGSAPANSFTSPPLPPSPARARGEGVRSTPSLPTRSTAPAPAPR